MRTPGVPNDAAMGQSNFTGKNAYCCESRCRPREANTFQIHGVVLQITTQTNGLGPGNSYGYNSQMNIQFINFQAWAIVVFSCLFDPSGPHSGHQNSSYAPAHGLMGA